MEGGELGDLSGGDSEGFGYRDGFTVGSSVSEVQAAFGARLAMPLRGRSHSGNAKKIGKFAALGVLRGN
jgi:hypothetical protein